MLMTLSTTIFADNYTYSATYGRSDDNVYYLDRRVAERKAQREKEPITAGALARCGYAFNYDAVTYGVSIFYQWNHIWGITAGFDGYYIPNRTLYRTLPNDTVASNVFALPMWDVRAGVMISKYFMCGAMLGKSNIGDAQTLINMRQDAWFIDNKDSNFMFGAFATFLLPVSKHFGFNIDLAITNKTGFNVGAGFNVTIPIK